MSQIFIGGGGSGGGGATDITPIVDKLQDLLVETIKIEGDTTNIQSQLTTLITRVQEGNLTLLDLEATLEEIVTGITTLDQSIGTQTSTLQTSLGNVITAVNAVKTSVDTLGGKIDTTNSRLSDINNAITATVEVTNIGIASVTKATTTNQTLPNFLTTAFPGITNLTSKIRSLTMAAGTSTNVVFKTAANHDPTTIPMGGSISWGEGGPRNYILSIPTSITFTSTNPVTVSIEYNP